jgi:signal transduction histidine kinase
VEGQGELPSDAHIAMYRIAQEALNNVTKHACANQVAVSLRYVTPHSSAPCQPAPLQAEEDGHLRVELSICDDGRGFDPARVPADHLGLNIMRERAQAIGAELTIKTQPGHGTHIAAVWQRPLTTEERL